MIGNRIGGVMLDELAEVAHFENKRHVYQGKMQCAEWQRNYHIVKAFESGNRQRDIGHVCGLSESTIKHIIAKLKKE